MIPNVYRIARRHGMTAEVSLLTHRLLRRMTLVSTELVRIVAENLVANYSARMVREALHNTQPKETTMIQTVVCAGSIPFSPVQVKVPGFPTKYQVETSPPNRDYWEPAGPAFNTRREAEVWEHGFRIGNLGHHETRIVTV